MRRPRLVLLGAGHSHLVALRSFGFHPLADTEVTLISNVSAASYSGMLPGYIAGHYTRDESRIELQPLCRFAGAEFSLDTATGLDLDGKRILRAHQSPLEFDFLSIDVGSASPGQDVPGVKAFALPIRPIDRFVEALNQQFTKVQNRSPLLRCLVAGGGAGGVELLAAVRHRFTAARTPAKTQWEFHLLTASETILPAHNPGVRRRCQRILERDGVQVHVDHQVIEVREHEVVCAGSKILPYDMLLWATGAAAFPWFAAAGLTVDAQGFISINPCLQSTSHPFVFAAGDAASMLSHPLPKSGVYAVRQGKILGENLRCAIDGNPLHPFHPQKQTLSLISMGDRYAVASRGSFACEGHLVWLIKDWIDRRWMRGFQIRF